MGPSGTLLTPAVQMSQAIAMHNWSDVARLATLHGPELASVVVSGTTGRPLHYAAAFDDDATAVTVLLRSGADPNMRRHDGASALHVAAKYGNVAAVDALLANGANVDMVSANGYTPLLDAVENNRRDVFIILLNAGAAVNYVTPIGPSKGHTALHSAARHGHVEEADLLLARGAAMDVAGGSQGFTPLIEACSKGHTAVVELLLDRGAAMDVAGGIFGFTPLIEACSEGHTAVVKLLLDRGAAMDVAGGIYGSTPLLLACSKGHTAVVELLLDRGAAMDVAGGVLCFTPLMQACSNGHTAVVELLLDRGAAMDVAGGLQGSTPLIEACSRGHAEIVEVLLARGASVQVVERRNGVTALHVATVKRFGNIVNMLVAHGADPRAISSKGETPLSLLSADPVNYLRMVDAIGAYERRKREGDGLSAVGDSRSPSQPNTCVADDQSRAFDGRPLPIQSHSASSAPQEHPASGSCSISDSPMEDIRPLSVPIQDVENRVREHLHRYGLSESSVLFHDGSLVPALRISESDQQNFLTSREERADEQALTELERCLKVLQSCSVEEDQKRVASREIQSTLYHWKLDRNDVSIPGESWQFGDIGSGGYGSVYKGLFKGTPVAIKLLHKPAAEQEEKFKFFREVTLLQGLENENIVKFYGAWWPDDEEKVEKDPFALRGRQDRQRPFIVTELMHANLKEARSQGLFSNVRAQVGALLSVSRALTLLHSKRVVHQDVNPENVLVRLRDDNGVEVKVSDFGLSRVVRRKVSESWTQSKARREGKTEYMAPEVLLKQCAPGFAGDVWSFGVLCNFVLRGTTGLQEKDDLELSDACKSGELVKSCNSWAMGIESEALRRIAVACLRADSSSRPKIEVIARELEDALAAL